MVNLKAAFVIFVLVSGIMFSPSYSFAQSDNGNNPFKSFFDIFMQLFSSNDNSNDVPEFEDAIVIQTSSSSVIPENQPPKADAGDDQNVMEFAKVTLDGSSSTDTDGTIISYTWTQTSPGPLVFGSSMTTVVSPMFIAPDVISQEILTFELLVVDDSSATDVDEVKITVNNKDEGPGQENQPPKADAGDDQMVMEFAKDVKLDGSSSTDSDGTIVSYKWMQISGAAVVLSSMSAVMPTFDAPEGEDTLRFVLTVTDDDGAVDDDEVEIKVKNNDEDDNDDNGNGNGGGNDDNGNEDKVKVCHIPGGDAEKSKTLEIGAAAVDAHLAHGDSLGECEDVHKQSKSNKESEKNDDEKKGNSKNLEDDTKSNSGKGNNDEDKNNSGKGNSKNLEDDTKSNSGKGNNDEDKNNSGKSNSKKLEDETKSNSSDEDQKDNEDQKDKKDDDKEKDN